MAETISNFVLGMGVETESFTLAKGASSGTPAAGSYADVLRKSAVRAEHDSLLASRCVSISLKFVREEDEWIKILMRLGRPSYGLYPVFKF